VEPGHRPGCGQTPARRSRTDRNIDGDVNEVAFSPAGDLLASADADGTVRLWNPITGRAVGAPWMRIPAILLKITA
jgi:WD40 repeat protein